MQTIRQSYHSLAFLMSLNWDRALYVCTIVFALMLGAFIGSL